MIDTSEPAGQASHVESGQSGETQGVLAALRAATAERHELLHEIMPLSVESVALRDYLAHLAILRDWLEPLEPWLATFSDGPQSVMHEAMVSSAHCARSSSSSARTASPRMSRLALIAADLAHESVAPHEFVEAAPSAPARAWSGAQSAAYRWGVCYVIDGSQLGGSVLYARLKDRLAPHPLGYLSAGRDSLGPRWRAFTHTMSAEVHRPAMIDEACRGAAEAFDRLIELAHVRRGQLA